MRTFWQQIAFIANFVIFLKINLKIKKIILIFVVKINGIMKKIIIFIVLAIAAYLLLPSFTSHKSVMSSIEREVKIDDENRCIVGAYAVEWNTNYSADEMFSNISSTIDKENAKHIKLLGVYTITFENVGETSKSIYRIYLKDNHFKIVADYTDKTAYEYFLKTASKRNPYTLFRLKIPEFQITKYANLLMY